ncbi:MAG: cache domain-containing protein, partial [Aminobacteriaceae bacterium]
MAANPGSVRDLLRRYRKLFAAAIVLLLVIVGFFELARVSRTTERNISYSLDMQSVALERWFALNLNFVRSIANLPSVVSGNYDEIFQDFQRIAGANSNFHNLSFVDREGNPVVQSDSGVIPAPKTNFSDRDYFIEAAAGRSYISDVISGRLVGKPIVVFSTPVITDGEFKGLVTGAILFDTILKTILSTKFGESGS